MFSGRTRNAWTWLSWIQHCISRYFLSWSLSVQNRCMAHTWTRFSAEVIKFSVASNWPKYFQLDILIIYLVKFYISPTYMISQDFQMVSNCMPRRLCWFFSYGYLHKVETQYLYSIFKCCYFHLEQTHCCDTPYNLRQLFGWTGIPIHHRGYRWIENLVLRNKWSNTPK